MNSDLTCLGVTLAADRPAVGGVASRSGKPTASRGWQVLKPGSKIGEYLVDKEIGSGSTSVVYRVRRPGVAQWMALKVLSHGHPEVVSRMLREGELMAALDHPNIVRLYEVLDVDTRLGLVMEWVSGPSLERWIPTRGAAPLAVRHAVAEQIVAGVAHAHRAGLVHRDLKPANVLLELRGAEPPKARITDFGLAKVIGGRGRPSHTQTGHALGTPRYMAPEQIRSAKHVDSRADVFSLGCVLYEIYCRRMTFPQTDMLSVFNAVCNGDFTDPAEFTDVPPHVANVIRMALALEPSKRPVDAADLHRRLWPDANATVVESRSSVVPPRRVRTPEPSGWAEVAAMGVGGLIGAGIAIVCLVAAAVALVVFQS